MCWSRDTETVWTLAPWLSRPVLRCDSAGYHIWPATLTQNDFIQPTPNSPYLFVSIHMLYCSTKIVSIVHFFKIDMNENSELSVDEI